MKAKRLTKWTLIVGPIAGPILLCGLVYWMWCWGWWGRGNLLMQAVFQCRCPAASEAARYPPFKVIASACKRPLLIDFSPSGRYLAIFENSPSYQLVRIDLEMGQTLNTGYDGATVAFVTDDLLVGRSENNKSYLLIDLSGGMQMHLPSYDTFDKALDKLKEADRVLIVHSTYSYSYIVGLSRDYKQNAQDNVVLFGDAKKQRWLDNLTENGIDYEILPPPYKTGQVKGVFYSLRGALWADDLGIYSAATGQQIAVTMQALSSRPNGFGQMGWVLDDRAVIYGGGGYRYLLEGDGSIFGHNYFPVPQPILLLEVPQQYWAMPTPEP